MEKQIKFVAIIMTFLVLLSLSQLMGSHKNKIWGIDISKYSGTINWQEIRKSNPDFVFIRATEGMDLKDVSFDKFWLNSKKNNILRGAYHFYVTEDDPIKQAKFFLSVVKFEKGDLRAVVDIEQIGHDTKAGLIERFKKFLAIIEKKIGAKPIIYTSYNFWNKHMSAEFGNYPLWIADYGVKKPKIPKGWKNWNLWQYKGDGKLKGVEKDVDFSLFNSKQFKLEHLKINLVR